MKSIESKQPSFISLIIRIISMIIEFFNKRKQVDTLIEKQKLIEINEKLKDGYNKIDDKKPKEKEEENVEILSDRLNNRF